MSINWTSYCASGLHDELIGPGGGARVAGRALIRHLSELGSEEIGVRQGSLIASSSHFVCCMIIESAIMAKDS